jgi:hypothetical protein
MVMTQAEVYQILIRGRLDPQWSFWLEGLSITYVDTDHEITCLAGPIRDQAALRGILNKLWDLNLELVSVQLMEEKDKQDNFSLTRKETSDVD